MEHYGSAGNIVVEYWTLTHSVAATLFPHLHIAQPPPIWFKKLSGLA